MVKIASSCCMALIAPGIIPTCLSNLTFVVWSPYYDAVLLSVYPVQGPSGSEVNPFAADAQVFFFHSRAVVFHHFVFHHFVFCISGRVLWSGVVVSPPSLPS